MRWEDMRRSENVRDRRGMAVGGGIGIGGILIALVVSWLTGINPLALLGVVESVQGPSGRPPDSWATGPGRRQDHGPGSWRSGPTWRS